MIFGELSAKVADFRSQFAQSRVIGVVVGTALIKLAHMLIDARTSIVREIEFLQNFDYTKLIVLFLILLWFFRRKPKKMFCAWCGGKKSGLTKETEYQGEWEWVFANKDGSRNLRKKNNWQLASFFSFWRCKKCSALTQAQHSFTENPNSSIKLWVISLDEDGEGERTAQDWEFKRGWLERSLDEMDITGFFSGADKDLKKMKRT